MKKMSRIFTRIAGIFIFALALTPGTLAEDAAFVAPDEPAMIVAAADGLINVAVYDALKSAGADEEKARAAAQAVALPERNHLATKSDLQAGLAELETRLFRAGAAAVGMILTLLVGLFAMFVGVWRKIADLAEKMPPPIAAH